MCKCDLKERAIKITIVMGHWVKCVWCEVYQRFSFFISIPSSISLNYYFILYTTGEKCRHVRLYHSRQYRWARSMEQKKMEKKVSKHSRIDKTMRGCCLFRDNITVIKVRIFRDKVDHLTGSIKDTRKLSYTAKGTCFSLSLSYSKSYYRYSIHLSSILRIYNKKKRKKNQNVRKIRENIMPETLNSIRTMKKHTYVTISAYTFIFRRFKKKKIVIFLVALYICSIILSFNDSAVDAIYQTFTSNTVLLVFFLFSSIRYAHILYCDRLNVKIIKRQCVCVVYLSVGFQ